MRGRLRPSPAMVVAFIALFVAIGGSSYAVTRLPAGSVGSKQLKKNAVTGAKVKNRSLTGGRHQGRVAGRRGLGGRRATSATHADAAGGLDKIIVRQRSPRGVPAAPPPDPSRGTSTTMVAGASATCPPGTFVIGGGVGVDDNTNTAVVDSFPQPGGHAWTARVDNSDPARGARIHRRRRVRSRPRPAERDDGGAGRSPGRPRPLLRAASPGVRRARHRADASSGHDPGSSSGRCVRRIGREPDQPALPHRPRRHARRVRGVVHRAAAQVAGRRRAAAGRSGRDRARPRRGRRQGRRRRERRRERPRPGRDRRDRREDRVEGGDRKAASKAAPKAATTSSKAAPAAPPAAAAGKTAPAAAAKPAATATSAAKARRKQAAAKAKTDADPSAPLLRALDRNHAVVLLFWNRHGSDDRAVRQAAESVDRRHGRVVVKVVPVASVGRYTAITKGVQILEAPTVLVIAPGGKARAIAGLTSKPELDQVVADVLAGVKSGSVAAASASQSTTVAKRSGVSAWPPSNRACRSAPAGKRPAIACSIASASAE